MNNNILIDIVILWREAMLKFDLKIFIAFRVYILWINVSYEF